jgi:hypothetical protein
MPYGISRAVVLGALLVAAAGCADDKVPTVVPPPLATLAWALRNDVKAATIVVGGTQQISAAPVYVDGSAATGLPAPTYVSLDPRKATVDANGLVTGVSPTSGVQIVAALTVQGITYRDTSLVAVTTTSMPLTQFTLETQGGDDPTVWNRRTIFLQATALSGTTPIPGVAVAFSTLDPNQVSIYNYGGGMLSVDAGYALGPARIVATATVYGVTRTDTLVITSLLPTSAKVYWQPDYGTTPPYTMYFSSQYNFPILAVGASVTFENDNDADTLFLKFDNSTQVDTILSYATVVKTIPAAGTFPFKDLKTGIKSVIIAKPQPTF